MNRFLLKPNKTAFFLCDIQEKFRPHIYQMTDVINTSKKMTEFSKLWQIPLIVTEQYPKALGSTCHDIDITHAVIKEPKTKFSMVLPTIESFLNSKGITNVVLFGIEAQVCITQTVLDLIGMNINVHVLADGISSINSGERQIALNRLSSICDITTSETIIFQIVKDASHQRFKDVSQLVKKFKTETANNKLLN